MISRSKSRLLLALVLAALAAACSSAAATQPTQSPPANGNSVKIAAVGDMVCSAHPGNGANPKSSDRRFRRGFCQYKRVSNLVVHGGYDKFLALGDLQYLYGRYSLFKKFYDPTYGRANHFVMPVPGNHESYSPGFAGYRQYFGHRAHWSRPGGYYSYDLGAWHVVALNSMWCKTNEWTNRGSFPMSNNHKSGCQPGDPMWEWMKRDLQAHASTPCTLVYFHHPAYFWAGYAGGPTTLVHPGYLFTRPLYRLAYDEGVDVILNGHEHFYERMQPLNPAAQVDQKYGFTEFIVGTGGDTLEPMPPQSAKIPQVAAASNTAFGILQMELNPTGYGWNFVPAAGSPGSWRYSKPLGYKIFENGNGTGTVDSGTAQCHGAPPAAQIPA